MQYNEEYRQTLSTILGFTPGLGDLKDIQEAITGVDLITGDKISGWERAVTTIAVFIPIVSGKSVRVSIKASKVDELTDARKVEKAVNGGDVAKIGHDFGEMGILVNNPNLQVDWTNTTQHGIDMMLERGVTQNMVNKWVKHGKVLQQSSGNYIYITKEGAAVLSKDGRLIGRLITTYPNAKFDESMKEIIKKLFND